MTEASHKLAEKMYQNQQGDAQQTHAAGDAGGAEHSGAGKREKTVEGDVVDAEFEEVKDKK